MMQKTGGGFVTMDVKEVDRDGVSFGIVEGYIASFMVEDVMWPDKFQPGAFLRSINAHKLRNDRPVRLNFMHRRSPIGGFPIDTVKEDDRGLFGTGEINLQVEQGREVYALAKQGVITDFSIGYGLPNPAAITFETRGDQEVRIIAEAEIFEGSLVDEPMNQDAQVTGVKAEDQVTIETLRAMTERDLESILSGTGAFSRKAVKALVAQAKTLTRPDPQGALLSDVLGELTASLQSLRG